MSALVVVAILAAAADVQPLDETRASWAYRRDVRVTGQGAFASLPVPVELARRGQPALGDLRLVEHGGTERPYVIERADAVRTTRRAYPGQLSDHRREPRRSSSWVVDLGAVRAFDRVELDVPQADFAKRLALEASDDGRAWRRLVSDAALFDREWGGRLHHTYVDLRETVRARFLRLTVDDRRSRPIEVTGVTAVSTRQTAAADERRAFEARLLSSTGSTSRYRLEIPAGTPVQALEIDADDPAFARRMVLLSVSTSNGRREETSIADKRLYRLRLDDEALAVADTSLPVTASVSEEWVLVVHDGDSPPLRGLRGTTVSAATRLLFPVGDRSLTLYYGNPVTRAPVYDIEALRARLAVASDLAAAELGREEANPVFRRPPPLPLLTTVGAPLEASRWRWARAVDVREEDLFTLRLSPEDLASARPDLADVRVVDAKDRQVPYILEHDTSEARVALESHPQDGASSRRVSRLALPNKRPLPIVALEVEVADRFFSRPVRVFVPSDRGEPRLVASSVLARREEVEGPPVPLRLTLDGGRYSELRLEIDEGDNAPLQLGVVRAVVQVPRVVFKARPGRGQLLVGNTDAQAPRYDLETLRREVLAYSAVEAQPGPLEANPRFRRSGRDYLSQAPPTLVLWGTLAAAVLGLLLLTARILRSPAA